MTKGKKKKKETIKNSKIIMASIALLLILSYGFKFFPKKEEQKEESKQEYIIEKENNGEFNFNTEEETTKEINLKMTNNAPSKKIYDLELSYVKNELTDNNLTYELFVNGNQKVFREVYPKEDMKLIDGIELFPSQTLEIKFILNYKKENQSEKKNETISGKLDIVENISED